MKEKDKKALHDQIVKEVKQDFEERRQKRRPVELAWRLNMNFLMGNQYASITPTGDIDDYGRQYYWQEREVYNHIAPIVETRLAKLTRVKSGVSIRPKTSDECDVQSAKFATAILQSIMEENCFSALLQKANGWAETCGSVFYKIAWNNEKGKKFILDGKPVYDGDVDITVCPPFEIYPENLQIESLQDQPSIIHAKAYSVDDVKRIWGVDVKGEDVNVFTLDKTGVTGGFGYTASVPKIIDEVRHDAVIVIEKYEKPTAKFKDGRLIIVAGDTLLYLGDLPYVNDEWIIEQCRKGTIADCGNGTSPTLEKIIDIDADAILISPFQNSGGYGRLDEWGNPIIEAADYMETSALGRAEWMKFYGMLYGAEAEADSMFAAVEQNYMQLKRRAQEAPLGKTLLMNKLTSAVWYVPAGGSTIGSIIADAHAGYAFAGDKSSGSLALPFETVLEKSGQADVWLVRYAGQSQGTLAALLSENKGYAQFKAFSTGEVYGCDTNSCTFYEDTPFHPDLLLRDFIIITHPEITDLGQPVYFTKMKRQ